MDDGLAWDETLGLRARAVGFVAALPDFVVRNLKDRIVWDMERFAHQSIESPCGKSATRCNPTSGTGLRMATSNGVPASTAMVRQ